jgi:hypothetical protein
MALLRLALMGIVLAPACLPMPGPLHAGEFDPAVVIYTLPNKIKWEANPGFPGTVPMPAGTFVTHYGQQVHFDGAKDEEATLLIVGDGPETPMRAETK